MKDVDLDFRLYYEQRSYKVALAAGDRQAKAPLDLSDSRLLPNRDAIDRNDCSMERVCETGAQLWSALLAGKVGELFEAVRRESGPDARFVFRLRLEDDPGRPELLESLPWEALYEENPRGGVKFLANHPGYVIARTPFERVEPLERAAPLEGPMRVLVAVPEGSELPNASREWRNLEAALEQSRLPVEIEKLTGRVTPDRLRSAVREGRWDVFHFIGHGRSENGRTDVRLNGEEEEETWINGGDLADLFQRTGLRLAVLNCCLGARPVSGRRLSGLGPAFLNAGAAAVVAMRHEIGDSEANRFALQFYRELLQGREVGRVDLAVENARESLYINQTNENGRPFITPVLFLRGDPRLFDPGGMAGSPAPDSRAGARIRIELPERLLTALAQGRCVPVVGPRLLAAGAVGSAAPIPDVRQLARQLAKDFQYPRPEDFPVCETAGDWMDSFLLQWVCQSSAGQRREVARAVGDAYLNVQPPEVVSRIAEWNVPGLFYLHFDELLETALRMRHGPPRVVEGVRRSVPRGDRPLLVYVKGNVRDLSSLVLTEDEHNRLWDDLGAMAPEILGMVRGYDGRGGRCLLFLGASPRDPLVKRLFSKLTETWPGLQEEGSVYFQCQVGETGDPYWGQVPVKWIEAGLEEVVESLTAAQAGGRP